MNLKTHAESAIDTHRDRLLALSLAIHGNPELCFEEYKSSKFVADVLSGSGYDVEYGVGALETAFHAKAGSGSLQVVLCAEYDALPGIGHACGHNLISGASVATAVALRDVLDELEVTLRIVGTPAEEGGCGKQLLLEAGVFDDAHCMMMVHPAPQDRLTFKALSLAHLEVSYRGEAAHTTFSTGAGVSAEDALTVTNVAIGLLRNHLVPYEHVNGVTTLGGVAANVVPDLTRSRWFVRAESAAALDQLLERVHACFQAGAIATGTDLELREVAPRYQPVRHDSALVDCFARNARQVGRTFASGLPEPTPSTDAGNVSQVVPTLHPLLGVGTPVVNHTAAFAAASASDAGQLVIRDGGLSLAWTIIDVASDPALRESFRNGGSDTR